MRNARELEERECEVLVALVRRFIARGLPVGSEHLARYLPEPLSSATIRNVMSELGARGFLSQAHVPAGRVPTDKAYRFYVDRMVSGTRLAPATARYIDETLRANAGELEQLMVRTSRILSQVSHNVGLVLAPALEEKLLEHIQFVLLPDRRVL